MLPIPFDPTELAPALPDVIAAIGLALVFAIVTFKPKSAPRAEDALEALQEAQEQLLQQQQPGQGEGS